MPRKAEGHRRISIVYPLWLAHDATHSNLRPCMVTSVTLRLLLLASHLTTMWVRGSCSFWVSLTITTYTLGLTSTSWIIHACTDIVAFDHQVSWSSYTSLYPSLLNLNPAVLRTDPTAISPSKEGIVPASLKVSYWACGSSSRCFSRLLVDVSLM